MYLSRYKHQISVLGLFERSLGWTHCADVLDFVLGSLGYKTTFFQKKTNSNFLFRLDVMRKKAGHPGKQ